MNFDILSHRLPEETAAGGDGRWRPAEHLGGLLIFFPTELRRGVKIQDREADAVACSKIVNLDTGAVMANPLVFGSALVPNVSGGVPDGIVLGRLTQGVAKGGNNPPWILQPHDQDDLKRCLEWLEAHNELPGGNQ